MFDLPERMEFPGREDMVNNQLTRCGGRRGGLPQSGHSMRVGLRNALSTRGTSSGLLAISHGGVDALGTSRGLQAELCVTGLRGNNLAPGRERGDHKSKKRFHGTISVATAHQLVVQTMFPPARAQLRILVSQLSFFLGRSIQPCRCSPPPPSAVGIRAFSWISMPPTRRQVTVS